MVLNLSIKFGVQMVLFLDNVCLDYFLIIYYVGYGYVGFDNQLYWVWQVIKGFDVGVLMC